MLINNLEKKIKLALIVSISSIVFAIIIAIVAFVFSYSTIKQERKKIYVLDRGVPVLIKQTDIGVTSEIEYKSHIDLFHSLFFTLPPDDEFMKNNIEKAMYLIDESGVEQYNTLKERGYYNSILSNSATVTIKTDSIKVNMVDNSFTYYGTQRIDRTTSILKRQLVTTGKIKSLLRRTDNNPHGLLITNWKTILNKDIDYKAKRTL